MLSYVIIFSVIIIGCTLLSRISNKLGIPSLLLFVLFGMLCGINKDYTNYQFSESICSVALAFIMFYGGYGTNWHVAKPVAGKAVLMSTVGVFITSVVLGICCHVFLKMPLLEGLLLGSVVGSTDAASVFSILRSKHLNLKHGLASLLEVESGSNDPIAYLLTITCLTVMGGGASAGGIGQMLFMQIFVGVVIGISISLIGVYLFKRLNLHSEGLNMMLMTALALLAYALPMMLGGNGFLSVYIAGIIFGNNGITRKIEMVNFFDGITNLMQVLVFFLLGLMTVVAEIPSIIVTSIIIALILTLIARPVATFMVLTPFKVPIRQQLFVSWAGLRGAASVLFAMIVIISDAYNKTDIYQIVLFVAIFSVAIQGTLLPYAARKLKLIDDKENVMKTFNDYQDESDVKLVEMEVWKKSAWIGQMLREINLPPDRLVIMIKRGNETIIPNGSTIIELGDVLVLTCQAYQPDTDINLIEVKINENHPWKNKHIYDAKLPENALIVMIKRGINTVIAKGDTKILEGDVLVFSGCELSQLEEYM